MRDVAKAVSGAVVLGAEQHIAVDRQEVHLFYKVASSNQDIPVFSSEIHAFSDSALINQDLGLLKIRFFFSA